MSIHDNIDGASPLVLARFWPWLNFFNFSMLSRSPRSLSGYWLSLSFRLIRNLSFFSGHKTVLHYLHGGC